RGTVMPGAWNLSQASIKLMAPIKPIQRKEVANAMGYRTCVLISSIFIKVGAGHNVVMERFRHFSDLYFEFLGFLAFKQLVQSLMEQCYPVIEVVFSMG